MGQNRPKFRIFYARKYTSSKKVHHRDCVVVTNISYVRAFFVAKTIYAPVFVAKTIYTLRPESFCELKSASGKVLTIWASAYFVKIKFLNNKVCNPTTYMMVGYVGLLMLFINNSHMLLMAESCIG